MKIFLKDIEQVSKIIDSNGNDITAQEMVKIRDGKHFIKQDEYQKGLADMEKYLSENDSHSNSPTTGKKRESPRNAPLPTFKLQNKLNQIEVGFYQLTDFLI